MTTQYRIESQWPNANARWRIVTPAPHSERHPFDKIGLIFPNSDEAKQVVARMKNANEGQYRVVKSTVAEANLDAYRKTMAEKARRRAA